MSAVTGMLSRLEKRRAEQHALCVFQLENAQRSGRTRTTDTEEAALRCLAQLDEQIEHYRAEHARMGGLESLNAKFRTDTTPRKKTSMINDHNLVYRQGDHKTSWLRDLVTTQTNRDDTGECRARLQKHAEEVATDGAYLEHRDLSRTDGSGGYAVPPAWLMNQYVDLARPGRAFANLCQLQMLPAGTDSINVPKLLTGTRTDVQPADNAPVVEQDLTDSFVNAPVRTISGQQGVAIQLIDQSPISFDQVVFRDLIADYSTRLDLQVLEGTGINGQVLGVNDTPGTQAVACATLDVAGIYSALANAIQLVHTTRFLPPEAIVMHPRRWSWLLTLLDDSSRPLFVPSGNTPSNAVGVASAVESQQVVGTVHGLPVVTDPNITTTAGAGDEDLIYVARFSDLVLWETGVKARVMPETRAETLTVLLQIYGYLAFSASRYAQSVVTVTGFPPPVW